MRTRTVTDLAATLDACVTRVGEMPDDELMESSLLVERALVHMLVEQQLRMNASVSHLRAV